MFLCAYGLVGRRRTERYRYKTIRHISTNHLQSPPPQSSQGYNNHQQTVADTPVPSRHLSINTPAPTDQLIDFRQQIRHWIELLPHKPTVQLTPSPNGLFLTYRIATARVSYAQCASMVLPLTQHILKVIKVLVLFFHATQVQDIPWKNALCSAKSNNLKWLHKNRRKIWFPTVQKDKLTKRLKLITLEINKE